MTPNLTRCNLIRFDSNYHFVVPEFSEETEFKLNFNKAVEEFKEAQSHGITTRPVVLGPVSFLALSKPSREAKAGFQPISLLSKLLPLYKTLLGDLKAAGAEWVQVDEPVLVLDSAANLDKAFAEAYNELSPVSPKIMLTTYFSRLDSNLNYVAKLLEMPPMRVYEVATFYTMFNRCVPAFHPS